MKNAALGDLVCVWHSEQAVLDSGKLSTVQRRDQLYSGDQVLQQSNRVESTTVSEHRQNKQERFARESSVRLNAYRGLLESKTDIMIVLLVVFMVLYIFEYLFQIPLLQVPYSCESHASPNLGGFCLSAPHLCHSSLQQSPMRIGRETKGQMHSCTDE